MTEATSHPHPTSTATRQNKFDLIGVQVLYKLQRQDTSAATRQNKFDLIGVQILCKLQRQVSMLTPLLKIAVHNLSQELGHCILMQFTGNLRPRTMSRDLGLLAIGKS